LYGWRVLLELLSFQITVMVPVTMEAPHDNGIVLYLDGTVHKVGLVVTSHQDNDFYPMERLSPEEMISFQVDVKREGFNDNKLPGDKVPTATGVITLAVTAVYMPHQATLVTLGPIWVKSTATFHVSVALPPGVTSMNMEVKCPNPSAAFHLPATILEDESGWLSRIYPVTKDIGYTTDKRYKFGEESTETFYEDITNSHPSDSVNITVVVGILALASGNHSCSLNLLSRPQEPIPVTLTYTAVDVPAIMSSDISIEPLEPSTTNVYAGESFAIEMDVTVPPWSGQDSINFTFQAPEMVGTTHFWRLCKAEIIDVSDDLMGMNHGMMEYSDVNQVNYSKSVDSNW
jgi:hypothetical protein